MQSAMTSRWFLSDITAIHESLHWTGSHITDRALYPFIFSIFTSVFHPESFSNPIYLRLWRNTLFCTSIQEARTRIIQASLIIPVFVLAGLISLIVEDLDLLPHQRRLSPLLGGSVVHNTAGEIQSTSLERAIEEESIAAYPPLRSWNIYVGSKRSTDQSRAIQPIPNRKYRTWFALSTSSR